MTRKALWSVALILLTAACTRDARPPPQSAPLPPAPPQPPPPPAPAPPWLGWFPPLLLPPGLGLPFPPPAATDWQAMEWEVVQRVNEHRARGASCGGRYFPPVPPLSPNAALLRASRGHSTDMAQRNYYSHRSPEGWGPSERARAAGYRAGAAENIHVQVGTAADVVSDWMQSTGHCENFMNASYRDIGVGHAYRMATQYGHYWTANMGHGG